jgi:caa(3)-type oxidase subunit IV
MSDSTAAAEPKPASHAHDEHGHAHHGDYLHHVKPYLIVGGLLFLFTIITVGLSYLDFEHVGIFKMMFGWIGVEGHGINIFIGLVVAAFKVGLVGAWFMHLKQEKAPIWRPLIFTFIFVLGLFLLFLLHWIDPIPTTSHWHH